MEEVLVREFPIGTSPRYNQLVGGLYRCDGSLIMKMVLMNVDKVSGEEKTTLSCSLTKTEMISFHNYIDMIAEMMCFEEPKEGMQIDSLSYCFAIESTHVTKTVMCTQ